MRGSRSFLKGSVLVLNWLWHLLYLLSKGSQHCAVLHYRFTEEEQVDLMSTYVPEPLRGRGVAALLSQVGFSFLHFSSHQWNMLMLWMLFFRLLWSSWWRRTSRLTSPVGTSRNTWRNIRCSFTKITSSREATCDLNQQRPHAAQGPRPHFREPSESHAPPLQWLSRILF